MSFDNDGYLIIHDVLTKEEVQEYRDELDNYLDNNRSFRAEESKILPGWAGNTPGLSDRLNNLHKDPRVLEEVSKIYKGQEFRYVNHSDLHQNKRTTWHRDIHDLERGGCNLGVWTEECFIIKASFLLQDHMDNKFGLLVQPGTHLRDITSQQIHLDSLSTDLIIFDQRILHSGQYNRPLYHNIYNKNRYLLTFGYGLNNAYSDFHDKGATLRQKQTKRGNEMTEHYKTFGLEINIDDSKLLNDDLKGRLKGQTWEQVEAKAVGYIDPNACVLELGACIGIVACLINNKISDKTKQVSIETNPDLIEQLTRVRDENNCKFEIVNSFVDTSIVNKKFSIHPTHAMGGRLGEVAGWKQVEKQSVTIENLEEKYNLKFDTLVMDIEGGEFSLWREGFFTDKYISNINLMMIEFHADQECSKMKEELKNNFEEIVISSSGGCHSVIVYKRK